MTTVPATFDAFRIHDDASGYRSGIERAGATYVGIGRPLRSE